MSNYHRPRFINCVPGPSPAWASGPGPRPTPGSPPSGCSLPERPRRDAPCRPPPCAGAATLSPRARRRLRYRQQQVVATLERDAQALQLLAQPVATVESDADGEREPGLYPDVAQAELRMLQVMVIIDTLGSLLDRLDPALGIFPQAVGRAQLDATEHSQASAGAGVGGGQLTSDGFLVDLRTVAGLEGTPWSRASVSVWVRRA